VSLNLVLNHHYTLLLLVDQLEESEGEEGVEAWMVFVECCYRQQW
jgi:hypothetical protein